MAKANQTNNRAAAEAGADGAPIDRAAARAELAEMLEADRTAPDFDHDRLHDLHFLAAGRTPPARTEGGEF